MKKLSVKKDSQCMACLECVRACSVRKHILLFHNFQHFHGAGLDANAAGDTLGNGILGLVYHHLGGADLHTLAAADAVFLVNHINAGFFFGGSAAGQ